MNFLSTFLLVQLLCAIGVLADYFLKIAGSGADYVNHKQFLIGFALHSSTAIGWFFVLKHMKLVHVGVFYSVSIVLMLTFIGVRYFGEQLSAAEIVGIVLAVASLMLLGRYA